MNREAWLPLRPDDVDIDEWADVHGIRSPLRNSFVRACCWDAVIEIPFGSIGVTDPDARVLHLLSRASVALERYEKSSEPTDDRTVRDLRFAARLPSRAHDNPWQMFSLDVYGEAAERVTVIARAPKTLARATAPQAVAPMSSTRSYRETRAAESFAVPKKESKMNHEVGVKKSRSRRARWLSVAAWAGVWVAGVWVAGAVPLDHAQAQARSGFQCDRNLRSVCVEGYGFRDVGTAWYPGDKRYIAGGYDLGSGQNFLYHNQDGHMVVASSHGNVGAHLFGKGYTLLDASGTGWVSYDRPRNRTQLGNVARVVINGELVVNKDDWIHNEGFDRKFGENETLPLVATGGTLGVDLASGVRIGVTGEIRTGLRYGFNTRATTNGVSNRAEAGPLLGANATGSLWVGFEVKPLGFPLVGARVQADVNLINISFFPISYSHMDIDQWLPGWEARMKFRYGDRGDMVLRTADGKITVSGVILGARESVTVLDWKPVYNDTLTIYDAENSRHMFFLHE